jgi:hypothetical protein
MDTPPGPTPIQHVHEARRVIEVDAVEVEMAKVVCCCFHWAEEG